MHELALFAGAGGGILGGRLLGWRTVCAVELDPYCRRVLLARQRDGMLHPFPIWDDVSTFDGHPWRGHVDIITGGFPCQDISTAGKGEGITGSKSSLWGEMARIIGEVRPLHILVENSPALTSRGLGVILGDLAAMGYDARWGVLGARHVGAPHRRDRIWILATHPHRCGLVTNHGDHLHNNHGHPTYEESGRPDKPIGAYSSSWWETQPQLDRVADGVADRVDRSRAIGNGQVPGVVVLAWRLLNRRR